MGTWLSTAAPVERRVFWRCLAGWSVDAFDNQIFSFAIPALMTTFVLTKADAGLVTSLSLVTTAIGGWLGGALSDRIGRVRALRIAIIWFAVASIGVALVGSYWQLLAARAIQGFGFGAEWAAGAVLMAESVRDEYRGRALGAVQSGWAIGWGTAAVVSALLFSWLPEVQAWRWLFALGAAPALLALYLQRGIPDRSVADRHGTAPASVTAALLGVFSRRNIHGTLAAGLLGIGAHGGYYGLFTWLPTFLRTERGLSVTTTSGYLAVIIVSFFAGCLTAGALSDRIGRRPTMAGYAVGCVMVTLLYIVAPIGNATMLLLGCPLGFCAAGLPACMGALFSELYPAGERGSGVGFCYNLGRLVAAGFPVLIGAMGDRITLGAAIAIDAAAAYSLVIVAIALLPRTRVLSVLTVANGEAT